MPGLTTLEESQALYDAVVAARGDIGAPAGNSPRPLDAAAPTLDPPYDMSRLEEHERLWQDTLNRRDELERLRLAPPKIQLYDGDYVLRGACEGWRGVDYEWIENDTGTCSLKLSLSHYLAQWVMNFAGRAKRNVHITIDKQGTRWSGFMDHYRVVKEKGGDRYLEVVFKHDYEQVKHILCWANPFLRPELQFPKLWVIFGPAKWCLLLTLFVNILRLEVSLWTLPDNPLDINEWMGPSFNPGTWRNIVKPFPLIADNSALTVVFSRFKKWHDVASDVLDMNQLTVTCRRYLPSQGDPHPFADLQGELDNSTVEDIATLIPLREGCLVWDIVDNGGWGTGTAFGGSLLTGLVRAAVNIGSDGTTEGIDEFTGDPTYPGEYYTPNYLGTSPEAPWVVFEEGMYTGIESSEFIYYEAGDTSFLTGGQSMPGVNEAFSAGVNMVGDFLTCIINNVLIQGNDGPFGGAAALLPPLGGIMDAGAKILYENTFLAFMEVPTLRAAAAGQLLALAGLTSVATSLGDFHLFEGWADGAQRAFTLSALTAIEAQIWATRARTSHTIQVADAAPYMVGENGYGHFWLGSRVGTTVLDFPVLFTIFVEKVKKIGYSWDQDGSKGWKLTIGYRDPEDPYAKALGQIRDINQGLGDLGIL